MEKILMPKGVALWLKNHTKLTLEQIAKFCNLPLLEVINAKENNTTIYDPVEQTEQLTMEEIRKCELDSTLDLKPKQLFKERVIKKKIVSPYIKGKIPNIIKWFQVNNLKYDAEKMAKCFSVRKSSIEKMCNETQSVQELDPIKNGFLTELEFNSILVK